MKKLKGYIFSRPFFNERVPQHIQNIINKDYCKKNHYNFLMSATEYSYDRSTFILNELIEEIKDYDGIVFYSLLQLPIDLKKRNEIFNKIIKKKKELHFAVENLSIKSKKDIETVVDIINLKLSSIENLNNKKLKLGKEKYYVNFRHKKSKRNYLERMVNDKVKCMKISKKYGKDYWDGNRKYGYGGYKYIENYHTYLAKKLISDYNLTSESKILDIGCGKGYLIYEISKLLNSKKVFGCDISKYAISNAKKEIKNKIFHHDARKKFKFNSNEFDFVFSNTTLHNFKLPDLFNALKEVERISKKKYICVESYRNEKEQFGVQCWALTAETIIDKVAWKWLFQMTNYTGDYEFIYFD